MAKKKAFFVHIKVKADFIPRFHSRSHRSHSRWLQPRMTARGDHLQREDTDHLRRRRIRRQRSLPQTAEGEQEVAGCRAGKGTESAAAGVGHPESEQGKKRKRKRSGGGNGGGRERSRPVGEWERWWWWRWWQRRNSWLSPPYSLCPFPPSFLSPNISVFSFFRVNGGSWVCARRLGVGAVFAAFHLLVSLPSSLLTIFFSFFEINVDGMLDRSISWSNPIKCPCFAGCNKYVRATVITVFGAITSSIVIIIIGCHR